ncbi:MULTISPECIES: TlpA family protein disulfide reductase [Sphingobacterium]|uniref:TlpA family protein disulfide reductase n=1 Tax=Sphingobacterium TaxID=28453 RepID=UPI00257A4AC4|nr:MULTISPECIES: TlpA disulfide reductase family protein [Sphingobacterium]
MKKLKLQSNSSALLYIQILKITVLVILYALLATLKLSAQSLSLSIDIQKDTSIHPLNIGDPIPDKLWNTVLPVMYDPQQREHIQLKDLQTKKLIIIDFWATWCAPCIASIKKLQVIEQKYADKFVLLPVTYENLDLLQRQMAKLNFHPFSVYSDPQLLQYFPHRSIPHQVWIMDNKVVHIGAAVDANEKNIALALDGYLPQMEVKAEFMDFSLTMPLDEFAKRANIPIYKKSVMTGYLKGISGSNGVMKTNGQKLLYYNNAWVLSMLAYATNMPLNRISANTVKWANNSIISKQGCYQLIAPEITSDDQMKVWFLDDLQASFNCQVHKEIRDMQVIKIVKPGISPAAKLEKLKYRIDLKSFIALLNANFKWKVDMPIYMTELPLETSIYANEPIAPLAKDQTRLAAFLKRNGLTLTHAVESLEMLVVDPKNESAR